ncbi:uncharacterized protein Ppp1r15 [Temnothorax nylanderi]|uniref:uncharacterized protein Ppp1r15 n=1 Tax=Temnothorax nylanderi TaxID=102681 RepID=UPI003A89FD60
MYSAQHTIMSYIAKKRQTLYVLRGEDNAPSSNDRRTSLVQSFMMRGSYLRNWIYRANNPLSVTVVNDDILTSGFLKNSSMKTKDLSYTMKEEKLLRDSKEKYPTDCVSMFGRVPESDYLQDWHIVDDSNSVKIRNDVNLRKNSGNTHDDNSTIESHPMLQVNEIEKTMNNMTDASGPLDVDPQKREVDIHKDTDVESFLVVSHSDVPTTPVDIVEESSMSSFSNVCRNAWTSTWNVLANRLYCKTGSARMSVKRPLYPTKQHYRRKANAIAIGRGRGRAKCQLRRSGVSQTIRRKECIKYEDYETMQNNLVGAAPSDHPLDSKFDSLNSIDPSDHVIKQIDSPSISSSPRTTTTRGKLKACKKKKTKARRVTKVRYIAKPSRMKDLEDSTGEMSDAQEDSSRSRTSSEHFAEVEDDWIVFEDGDDEKLSETREKRGATEYPIRARYVPNSMRKRDSSYEDSNSETHDAEEVSFRMRLSSESSTDSEDSNHSSIVFDEQEAMGCPRMHGRLTNISDKYCEDFNSLMQKHSFQRCRLPSNSSETSDDSNISETSDTSNSSFATEGNDDVDGYNEVSFHDGDSIVFADDDCEASTAQTKKVSFDPTPVVHVMVTWNYAYRAARRGPWEEIARDTERFRGRINSIAIVLDPILKSTHRSQVWQERFAFPE